MPSGSCCLSEIEMVSVAIALLVIFASAVNYSDFKPFTEPFTVGIAGRSGLT